MAVDYNEFVAQTTNQQTVLNILRAREREPMHFTSFSEVFGTLSSTGSAALGASFPGDGRTIEATSGTEVTTNGAGTLTETVTTAARTLGDSLADTSFSPSLGVEVSSGTDFRIAANATDDFYRGILSPVSPGTVIHFLRQGYPADLLSHLLVSRLEFWVKPEQGGDEAQLVYLATLDNDPDNHAKAAAFAAAVRCRPLDYGVERSVARRLPVSDLSKIPELPEDRLHRIEPIPNTASAYAIEIPEETSFSLQLAERVEGQCGLLDTLLNEAATARRVPLALTSGAVASAAALGSDSAAIDGSDLLAEDPQTSPSPGLVRFSGESLVVDVTLRSVHGMLYYLGEYVRGENGPLLDGDCSQCLPILRVVPANEVPRDQRFVSVVYRGARYSVPLSGAAMRPEAGRSSQTIDIVQQFLNLNRKASDLPSTPLVRVAN